MKKIMCALRFIFRNGETWTVKRENIGDLWIKQVTTSFGRINEGEFEEIHPCESFRIEILNEADHVNSNDINKGGLEAGMFARVKQFKDIEKMDILYRDTKNGEKRMNFEKDTIYFPYAALDTDGHDNAHQTSVVLDETLYIVVDPEKTVSEIYPETQTSLS
ncbi:MAG: hypothetical protein L0L57_02360 [Alkalibacterium sp.]|uniref:Uncharacterized protein n=1 Tax=Alkalibacterium gilvum TaxID=1130080 RepID=A0A1H6RJJ9_9LACT|nr:MULTISPECIES: hypothetical protein [Alkalibacterium]MDN6295793.1 hypothetical protein [Alkalibacterium sp.]MDN6397917.1 hypothetical protein [Alkalibacterium sp.]MDN6728992.1 hypothetical protein [Alkalibacterium sp.]SEI55933.1 hypothetical protein SAMN04488113_10350 [Alkalibacterium gilvum]